MGITISNLKDRIDTIRGVNPIEADLSSYRAVLGRVNDLGTDLYRQSDSELKQRSESLRMQAVAGSDTNLLLPEFFALAREAADRTLGMRPFDVQVIAGVALDRSKLVEMQTGEGKTLAAVLPAALNALSGKGVHVLTFNDYLARRDAEWMRPVYEFLGLSVGFIAQGMSPPDRRRAYASDITYATAKEAGFDFLRTHLCREVQDVVVRPYHFAIVDEADSILIDEARTPLVIAGDRDSSDVSPYRIADVVSSLKRDTDWETDENQRNVFLTDTGLTLVESMLGDVNLHDDEYYALLTEVNQALHARTLLHRNVDYIVRDGVIELVDEFTGRVVDDRRWPDGLQAALEAKERLEIRPGGRILGSISMQHFLGHYPELSGMTATAQPAAEEFVGFYNLKVVPIPPNQPCVRQDLPDDIYTHREAKDQALMREIRTAHRSGRPVLVGTRSVEESERIATMLADAGFTCRVLNAKNDELEAEIVADAGRPGAITISTNMAGRGTDIKLGGAHETDRERVVRAGGLHVIGTNRHENRRIDQQLRGRSGRQGDPGSSKFIVSLDDQLMVRFGIDELIPEKLRPDDQSESLSQPVIRREVDRLQRIVEGQNYDIRKSLYEYSAFVEKQRNHVQSWRMQLLSRLAHPKVCAVRSAERYLNLTADIGSEVGAENAAEIVREAERAISLHHIDEEWADHLAEVSRIREGIHLVGLGGLRPLEEFRKQANDSFKNLLETLDDRIVETFDSITITANGIDARGAGLEGPSSTWTYLVNDQAVSALHLMLFGQGSYATGAGAALMTGPLLLLWGIRERMKR